MKENTQGTSLVVQGLKLCALNAGGWGLIPGQGTRFHMPQQRSKVPCATSKTWCNPINNNFFFFKRENTQITKTRNERGDITNDATEIKIFLFDKKEYFEQLFI